jgi:hypothetical protein
VLNLRGGGQRQSLFGPQDIDMAQARRQDQREQRHEEEPSLHKFQAMVPFMIGK